jgi:hypothetical protein
MNSNISAFNRLREFIRGGMRMSHIYQPVMLRELLRRGGKGTRREMPRLCFVERVTWILPEAGCVVSFLNGKVIEPPTQHISMDSIIPFMQTERNLFGNCFESEGINCARFKGCWSELFFSYRKYLDTTRAMSS